jgi:hypothetical protein
MTQSEANAATVNRMFEAEPVLVGVARAGDVVPGMGETMILTSGPRTEAGAYEGGQRRAVAFGAIYEGLASDENDAWAKIEAGELQVEPCQDHGCIGSVAGIYTASMPVFVVKNRVHGNLAFCNLYEGASRRRLNYGVYDEEVAAGLRFLEQVVGPVLDDAVREAGEVPLKAIIRRALNMGDELHSRNTAASLLFSRALFPALVSVAERRPQEVDQVLAFLAENDYFFLRLSMAAAKAVADAAHGIPKSSVLTGMCLSGREFAIRVSGLDEWVRGPLPTSQAKLFEGFSDDDIEWMGGESCMTEAIGLGGFAHATAPSLQAYQGGTPDAMRETNLSLYEITVAENPDFKIPYLGYRGTPTGIDLFAVLETGILPTIDAGLAGKEGGQIGAGTLLPPLECFEAAAAQYEERYGERGATAAAGTANA